MKNFFISLIALVFLPSVMRAQTDMTSKIQNADLSSNEGWEITCTAGQGWATQKGTAPYNVSEAYAGWGSLALTEYSISQKVTLPKGAYELSAYGFYRYGEAFSTDPTVSNAVLFAGDDEVAVVTLGSIEGLGSYANSVDDASSQFSQGNYLNTLAFNVMEDGTEVEIGFKGTHDLMRSWFICGPFKLVQTSETPVVADLTELIQAYNDAKAAAQAVDGKMSADARAALDAAIAAEVDMESEESLKAATKALTTATNAAKTSITRFEGVVAYLAKMGAVLDLTNVYTPEAYATYFTDVKSAYDNGTMTDAEAGSYNANAAYSSGWHAANFIDDVLLSSWTIGGNACSEYTQSLYINTWSVEGITDGSNLLTPFFEYWTGDDNTLGNTSIVGKVEGVTPGTYIVQVLARVRRSNSSQDVPTGITMSVNGGEAVDLCAGEQSTHENFSMMFYGTFTAEGVVGDDGILNVEINVDGTNCSWLAFRDVMYMTPAEKAQADLDKAYEAALAAIKAGNYYQIYTLVDGTPYYLTNGGTLTANAEEAYSFHLNTVRQSGTLYEVGWNMGVPFTNPTLSGGSTGDVVNDGSIHRNSSNRNDWERQALFLQDGKYAVRSTNANSANWGANTYWDMTGTTELPEAGYSLEPQYIWQFNDVTGVALLNDAKAMVAAKEGVGDGLFMKTEADFATLESAVNDAAAVLENMSATSEEKDAAITKLQAAIDAYKAAPVNQPDPANKYKFQQKASELFMGLSESGVNLASEENAAALFFEAGENGGYYLKTDEGLYVGFDGGNAWTMSTSADKKYEWLVTYVGENYYTLSKPSNGNHHVGTNDGATAEGDPCYADKNNSDKGFFYWMIMPVADGPAVEDVTYLIKNPAYLENGYEYWTYTENAFKPRTYEAPMNLITYSGNAEFSVSQTIKDVPAGLYKLTVNAFYRAGSLEDEMAAIAAGTELLKDLEFYAEIGDDTYSKKVMNLSEGASATSYNSGDAQLADGKYVPNSAAGSRDWYIAGEYTNELLFNVFEDGTTIYIGLEKGVGLPSDYCPIGAWHLYRLGDPDETQAQPDEKKVLVYTDLTQADYHTWTAPDATGEITGDGYCVYEVGNSAGNIYGNPNVTANDYADLSDCLALLVNVSAGAPRFLFNRPTNDSQDYINIPNNAEQTAKYMATETEEDGTTTYIIDVQAIVADYGFCHLNALKGANWQDATVVFMKTVKEGEGESEFDVYTGIVEQTQLHPQAGPMGTTVSDQTVTVASAGEGLVNITFSGFTMPMAALGSFPEFIIENVSVTTGDDGTIYYSADNFQVTTLMGQMTVGYAGTLEGEQAGEDATPVFKLVLQNATIDEVYFGPDQAAIDAYKAAHEIPEVPEIVIDFERIAGKGYGADPVPYDEAAILEALGAASWDEITKMYPVVMTTGEAGEDFDGWRNVDGDPQAWSGDGANLGLCLKYPHDGSFALCTHPGNDPKVGDVLTAAWILSTEAGKSVIVKVNVTFIEQPEVTFEVVDMDVKTFVEYNSSENDYVEKVASISEEEAAAILSALGLESFDAAEVWGYNPTTGKYVEGSLVIGGGIDGWRDANGDFHNWSGKSDVPACVKYTNGIDYYCYNIKGCSRQTIPTYWAITNGTKAVLVEVDFIYTEDVLYTVGSEDLNDPYAADRGPVLTVQNGQTAHFDFDNLSKAEANYQNWVLFAQVNGEDKVALRADNWENIAWNNEGCVSDYNWDTFTSDMNGSKVAMDVKFLDGELSMTAVITTAEGKTYNYSYTKSGFSSESIDLALSEEAAHLIVYKAYVDGEAIITSISGIKSDWNDGKVHKVLRDGKIVIIKGEKEYDLNGAAIK